MPLSGWVQDVIAISARPYGQRAVLKFAQYTGNTTTGPAAGMSSSAADFQPWLPLLAHRCPVDRRPLHARYLHQPEDQAVPGAPPAHRHRPPHGRPGRSPRPCLPPGASNEPPP